MKRLIMIIALMAGLNLVAGNNPTNLNSSYKNTYAKGGKASKGSVTDQVERNYKKQGALKVNRTGKANVNTGGTQKSYKHSFGL